MFGTKLPDITLAQVLALVTFIIGQAVAYGWVEGTAQEATLSGATAIVSAAWMLVDSLLRGKRNEVRAAAVAIGKVDPAEAEEGSLSAARTNVP